MMFQLCFWKAVFIIRETSCDVSTVFLKSSFYHQRNILWCLNCVSEKQFLSSEKHPVMSQLCFWKAVLIIRETSCDVSTVLLKSSFYHQTNILWCLNCVSEKQFLSSEKHPVMSQLYFWKAVFIIRETSCDVSTVFLKSSFYHQRNILWCLNCVSEKQFLSSEKHPVKSQLFLKSSSYHQRRMLQRAYYFTRWLDADMWVQVRPKKYAEFRPYDQKSLCVECIKILLITVVNYDPLSTQKCEYSLRSSTNCNSVTPGSS